MPLAATGANAEQIKYWNETAGPRWASQQDFIEPQIAPLGLLGLERARIGRGERVLDVGCGCGSTTLEIARRVGPTGFVLGVDISGPMLDRARAELRASGQKQVELEHADAQTHALPPAAFDVVFSRFGVMFFADPTAAFANLRGALRPGGRLTFVCWQPLQRNPWMLVPLAAAAPHLTLPPAPPPGAPGPFAFGDRERVQGILEGAGFRDVQLEGHSRMLSIGAGADLDAAVGFIVQMGPSGAALREASEAQRAAAIRAVREALAPHHTPEGVRLEGAVWIATAAS